MQGERLRKSGERERCCRATLRESDKKADTKKPKEIQNGYTK